MTTRKIYEAAATNKECLFYFGDDVASFSAANTTLFDEEKAEKFLQDINEDKKHYPGAELELVLRTKNGYFVGWNIFDSIDFYELDLKNRTCGWRKEVKVFDCRRQKAVIL